jgi:hypothetical protein
MKSLKLLSKITLCLFFFHSAYSQDNKKSTVDFDVTLTSNYIWRDFLFDYEAIQTNATYTYKDTGLYFNGWSSVGNTTGNDLQTTLTLGYTKSLKNLELGAALIFYHPTFSGSRELLISAGFPIKKINTSTNIYIADNKAVYFSVGIPEQRMFSINKYPVMFNTSLGYRANDIDVNNGFRDLNIGLSIPVETTNFTFSFYATYTNVLAQKRTRLQIGTNVYFK